jgi:hypothetical protein
MRSCLLAASLVALAGCSSGSQVDWPELFPVKGTVTQGGKSLSGGNLLFHQTGSAEYLVSGNVEADGTFTLNTAHARDRGTRKTGAPTGKYRVTYTPLIVEPSTPSDPIDLKNAVTIEARENALSLDLPKKK